jgi:two-component system, OmpR family, phosphate regulon response regulator OmpR
MKIAKQRPSQTPADDATHVLIVDDDQRIRDLLAIYLRNSGFRVTTANDTTFARSAMRGMSFDAILLDVMMPGESGLEFAREIRRESRIPILMMTALGDTANRVEGLETGVDDYVAKPFEPRELLLRLKNIMRRSDSRDGSAEEVRMGDFVFHIGRGELRRGAAAIKLTERERDLLRQFALRPGTPIARFELAGGSDTTASERAVDVQINRLRRKIESDPTNPVYLQTSRGKGYVLYTDR